jgi:hypothetical protein
MAAKKSNAGHVVMGLAGIAVTLWAAAKFGPKVLASTKGATGSGFALGGGTGGASARAPIQTAPSSQPGGSASGVQADLGKIASAIAGLFKKGPETVAQALQRGHYTSANQGALAAIYNLQQTGNPYGDPFSSTLAAFGLTPSPEDSLLQSIDASNPFTPQTTSAFDFGSFGFAPSDFYGSVSDWWDSVSGPTVQTADSPYIDQQSTSLLDFGSWGLTPDQFGANAGTYQGDTMGVASYSGSYADSQLDPTYNPAAGYDAAAYSVWDGYSGPVMAPDPWGAGAMSPYGISDQIFS